MEAKLQSVKEMQVVGIEIRTSNQDEMNPATAQIPALWGRFCQEKIIDRAPAGRTFVRHQAAGPIKEKTCK